MAAILDDKTFTRLTECVENDYRAMSCHRQLHTEFTELLSGDKHPANKNRDATPTPLNIGSMAIESLVGELASDNPRVMATTNAEKYKTISETAAIAMNRMLEEISFGEQLEDAVLNSMYSIGCMEVGATFVGTVDGMRQSLISESFDIYDLAWEQQGAKRIEESDWVARQLHWPLADVQDHPMFSSDKNRVEATSQSDTTDEIDPKRGRNSLSRGYIDYVSLWQVYDRRRNRLVLFPRHQRHLKLYDEEFTGAKWGPYLFLYYWRIPGLATPMSLAQRIVTMHQVVNVLNTKSHRQEQASKGILKYGSASKAEAELITQSPDNWSALQDQGDVAYVHYGGASPSTVAMEEKMRRDLSYVAYNMDQRAGLQSQAPTLGQERLLAGASNASVEKLQKKSYRFTQMATRAMYDLVLRDEVTRTTVRKPVPGFPQESIEAAWTPEVRAELRRMGVEIDVEPYSLRQRGPDSRLADYLAVVDYVNSRLRTDMAAQGVGFDVAAVLKNITNMKNEPMLNETFIYNQEPAELAALMGPRTTSADDHQPHRYVRESISSGQGQEQEMMRMFRAGTEAA